jgi:hypothetical protein
MLEKCLSCRCALIIPKVDNEKVVSRGLAINGTEETSNHRNIINGTSNHFLLKAFNCRGYSSCRRLQRYQATVLLLAMLPHSEGNKLHGKPAIGIERRRRTGSLRCDGRNLVTNRSEAKLQPACCLE